MPSLKRRSVSLQLSHRAKADAASKQGDSIRVRADSAEPTAPTAETLKSWLQAVAGSQDRELFARLHGYFAPRLTAWLSRTGLPPVQIEDIVQETLIAIWRKARLYDPKFGGVSTWVFVIARNQRVDFLRRKQNRATQPLEDWDPIDDSPSGEDKPAGRRARTEGAKSSRSIDARTGFSAGAGLFRREAAFGHRARTRHPARHGQVPDAAGAGEAEKPAGGKPVSPRQHPSRDETLLRCASGNAGRGASAGHRRPSGILPALPGTAAPVRDCWRRASGRPAARSGFVIVTRKDLRPHRRGTRRAAGASRGGAGKGSRRRLRLACCLGGLRQSDPGASSIRNCAGRGCACRMRRANA